MKTLKNILDERKKLPTQQIAWVLAKIFLIAAWYFGCMHSIYHQATGIGGRGYFWYTPPGRKFFENTPPLEILGQATILFFLNERKSLKFTLI